MKASVKAYAKINLYLAVTGRRPNGYHDIESVMQSVSLHDTVTVELSPAEGKHITLTCTDPSLPTDEKNLAYRAAAAYLEAAETDNVSVSVAIEKNIPVAAGLAGGSADAAGTLMALNSLSPRPFTREALAAIGAKLGADIPFIIYGGTMTAMGIGEILAPCSPLRDAVILIVRPKESVSTAAAYRMIDERGLFGADTPLSAMTNALDKGALDSVAEAAYNVFEKVLPRGTEVFGIKKLLSENGAVLSMMSGSGPSVFGLFKDEDTARAAYKAVTESGYGCEICYPVDSH